MTAPPKQGLWVVLASLLILAGAAWLRGHDLSARPMHFDESTNARILGTLLDEGSTPFDPTHFHGPLLSQLSAPIARLRGETNWNSLTKTSLRLTVFASSLLLVGLGLALSRWGQPGDGLAAGLLLATSPLLVYYGRMYIHEPLFITCGLLTLLCLLSFLHQPTRLSAAGLGIGLGLMAATRETWVISVFAWGIAGMIWLRQAHPSDTLPALRQRILSSYGRPLLLAAGLGFMVIALSYTSLGRHPSGIVDFFRTYLVYAPMEGHEKSFTYFAELLLWPKHQGGVWWTEIGIVLLAGHAVFRLPAGPTRATSRFLFTGGLIHLLAFSIIAYKTPWLACLGWVQICLVAGMGAAQMIRQSTPQWRIPASLAVLIIVAWQAVQSHRAAFRFASDNRNPYAYVPTSKDAERLAAWLDDLALEHEELKTSPVTVVGSGYWPLPWYLRSFDRVGYWPELPEDAGERPLLILMPPPFAVHGEEIEQTHAVFPRGLRHEVPVMVAIRKDLWDGVPQ